MKKIKFSKILFFSSTFFFSIIFLHSTIQFSPQIYAQPSKLLSPLPDESEVLGEQKSEENTSSNIELKENINILLLGLDARRGDGNPRCDALHMISFDSINNAIFITSIPRGTIITLPGKDKETSIIGNACHRLGYDFVKREVERLTGLKADYIVKTGFSQTMGIIRDFNLPTVATLQYLRNRSLPLGDYQRSHNQAVFIKDMILNHLEDINTVPKPLRYLLYKTIDTDLPYDTASEIFDRLSKNDIKNHPENILIYTKTTDPMRFKDMHLANSLTAEDLRNDQEFQDYQNNLEIYLNNLTSRLERLISSGNLSAAYRYVRVPFSQKIWLQIDNEEKRNSYHYQMLKGYVLSSTDKSNLSSQILDFITEMEIINNTELKNKGEELLSSI